MIRRWTPADAHESYAVYVDAVRNGAGRFYSEAQRQAWVPSEAMEDWWAPRLSGDTAWVSTDNLGLTGLIALRPDGYLDLFFVAPRARGDGTALDLYSALLDEAVDLQLDALKTHASDYLKPFLERRGWHVIEEELAERFGVTLRRWSMRLDQVGENQRS